MPFHSLGDEVIVELRPVGRPVQAGRGVSQDLEQGSRGVHVLQGRLAIAKLNCGHAWTKHTQAGVQVWAIIDIYTANLSVNYRKYTLVTDCMLHKYTACLLRTHAYTDIPGT